MCEGPEARGKRSERKPGGVGKGYKWDVHTNFAFSGNSFKIIIKGYPRMTAAHLM